MMDFFDEQRMSRLYEKFILEYYRKEHPHVNASASFIDWALDDGVSDGLPAMRSDITLSARGRAHHRCEVLRVHDAEQLRQEDRAFGEPVPDFRVREEQAGCPRACGGEREVSGMLLYAATDEDIQPDATYHMSGNRISARTLDLDRPFEEIRAQLDGTVEEYFPGE